nr:ABC transporter permease [uncultured Niameybacter sp.]
MKKESNKVVKIVLVGMIILMNIIILMLPEIDRFKVVTLSYDVNSQNPGPYHLFYSNDNEIKETQLLLNEYSNEGKVQRLEYKIPNNTSLIRIDVGNTPGETLITRIYVNYGMSKIDITDNIINATYINQIEQLKKIEDGISVKSIGEDPYIVTPIDISSITQISNTIASILNYLIRAIMCLIITILGYYILKKYHILCRFLKEIYYNRVLIYNLSKNDFKTKYAGSYLGIIWAFIQPIVTVLIYWFVFQVGFKSAPMDDFPFVLWLVSGIVPWFFFSEALVNATNSFIEYSYLVKKVVFKISILPIVKIISAFFVHIFFIVFANLVFIAYGYKPSIYMIQVIYYSICTFAIVLAISYITSAMIIFFKDLGQIIGILLQFGMWMTPIMWSYNMVGDKYQWILKLNPLYYIVEGYRDTFINHVWFWERYNQTIYFWGVTIFLFIIGVNIFKKLKPHFADVL